MRLCFLDHETFWSETHSLSKMSPIDYCMHPETELQLLSIKFGHYPTDVFVGEDQIRHMVSKIDWSDTFVIAHNGSGFDHIINAWRLGIRPAMWGCTLAMARPIHAKTVGLSLAKLVQHYGLGTKDNRALIQTRGKKLKDFTAQELKDMITYNRDGDTEQCAALFHKLKAHYTPAELWHIDCNIRMLVEPQFELDTGLLQTALSVERANKHKAIIDVAQLLRSDAGISEEVSEVLEWGDATVVAEYVREQLASAPKFSALLESRGVEVPMKTSPTNPDKQVPALAKTDEAFQELQDHEDPIVAAAARARLAVKSTLLETRIQAFLAAGEICGGRLPVPLKYCGADTTGRDSGESYNPQNMPRINPDKPKVSDALRNGLRAPKGYLIGVADQSGIELRVNHFLWQVRETMAAYAASPTADLYKDLAAWYYRCAADEVAKPQRQMGKVMHLGLGFGAGADTFVRIARLMGGITLTPAESENAVTGWRTRYANITQGWKTCGAALNLVAQGLEQPVDPWGMVTTCSEGLRLPSGRLIRYPGLRYVDEGQTWPDGRAKKSWVYAEGRHKAYLSGPKVDENCLSGDTIVLTNNGWKTLTCVSLRDKLWDGENWVAHQGVVCNGVRPTIDFGGVRLTPDHRVYEDGRWTAAADTEPWRAAEAYQGSFWLPGRNADSGWSGWLGRTTDALARSVRLWARGSLALREPHQGQQVVRMLAVQDDWRGQPDARAVQAPGVPGLELHAATVHPPVQPRLEELWGPRDQGVPRVGALVCRLLGRHGADMGARSGAGQEGQRRQLRARQLPMGVGQGEQSEQPQQSNGSYAARADALVGCCRSVGAEEDHATVPSGQRLARGPNVRQGGLHEPVYDIINAGPNHRFTVALADGRPIVVHNCVQALARDSVFEAALRFFRLSRLRPIMRLHDELIYMFPVSEAESLLAELQKILRTSPSWWPELVVWSEGDVAETYGAAK